MTTPARRTTWDTGEACIAPVRHATPIASTPSHATAWKLGLAAAASLVTGIVLAVRGDQIDQSGQQGAAWMAWGVILILAPILISAFALVLWFISQASAEARHYKSWKQTLAPQQQLGIKAAETAALYAAWAGVHHWVKEGKERSAAQFQERSAHTQMTIAQHQQHVAAQDAYQDAYWGAGSRHGAGQADLPVYANGSHTPRSDIYGNLI